MPSIHPHGCNLRKGRYSEPGRIYFVTTSCFERRRRLAVAQAASIVIEESLRLPSEGYCESLAFVAMPDHIHWLVQLKGAAKLSEILQKLKGRSARRINRCVSDNGRIWQAGYHDHALRREEDLRSVGAYLIHNPLRAGLVRNLEDYPHWYSVWHPRGGGRG